MSKTYVIADLHGRIDVLEEALERIEASPSGGTVVFTGDYVDRGPWSRQVVERIMAGPTKPDWKWIALKGNHEDMMVGAIRGNYEAAWWIGNGGGQTIASYPGGSVPEAHLLWIAALPHYHFDGKRIFVHAGVDETLPLAEQTEQTLLWKREGKHRDSYHPEGYVVHGHTPFEDGPIVLAGRVNLDTAAVWTGRLEVAIFDDEIAGPPVGFMTIRCPALSDLEAA